jgi:ATP-dependent DNA helicase RecG
MWFNQPYIAKMWADGALVQAVGKVTGSPGKIYIANPQLHKVSAVEADLFIKEDVAESVAPSQLFAVYPESRGITSLWFRYAIEKVLTKEVLDEAEDPIPLEMLKRYNLPSLKTALVWMHKPEKAKEAEAARKRFAFEEIFFIQLARQKERLAQSHEKSFSIEVQKKDVEEFMSHFPFTATPAQMKAINAILADTKSGRPMSRLLEGDVGSGKTAVAATAAYAVVHTRPANQNFGTLQVAYMAPTEILAKQHFESFIKYFEHHPINIGLITGSGCYKFPSKVKRGAATTISRAQLLKWVAGGEIPVVIGTHALIEKAVQFKHLALVIIDEQHRFGTNQRRKLAHKDVQLPHLLSMTATPIPRTLALTIYGDLDLTLLDQMPPGRKPIITKIVKPDERKAAYEHMRGQLNAGRQAYVICPRIDEPDPDKAFALMAKSVKEEAKRLKKDIFPEFEIAILAQQDDAQGKGRDDGEVRRARNRYPLRDLGRRGRSERAQCNGNTHRGRRALWPVATPPAARARGA